MCTNMSGFCTLYICSCIELRMCAFGLNTVMQCSILGPWFVHTPLCLVLLCVVPINRNVFKQRIAMYSVPVLVVCVRKHLQK